MGRTEDRRPITVKEMGTVAAQITLNRMALHTLFALGSVTSVTRTLEHFLHVWRVSEMSKGAIVWLSSPGQPIDYNTIIYLVNRMALYAASSRNRRGDLLK